MTFKELLTARLNSIEKALYNGQTSDTWENELNGRVNMFILNGWQSKQDQAAYYSVIEAARQSESYIESLDNYAEALDALENAWNDIYNM